MAELRGLVERLEGLAADLAAVRADVVELQEALESDKRQYALLKIRVITELLACELGDAYKCARFARGLDKGWFKRRDPVGALILHSEACRLGFARSCSDVTELRAELGVRVP